MTKECLIPVMSYWTDRESLLRVRTTESGNLHISWLLEDGKVLAIEDITENYPHSSLCVYNNIVKYIKAIKDVYWINDDEYISHMHEILENYGFPYDDESSVPEFYEDDPNRPSFYQLYKEGKASLEGIDDYIEKWRWTDTERQLHEYLGLTAQQFETWVKTSQFDEPKEQGGES